MAGNFSDTTNIIDNLQADAADVKTPIDALDDALFDFSIGDRDFLQLRAKDDSGTKLITIASGAVTISNTYHKIANEASAASDDLDTINGGQAGDILILQPTGTTNVTKLKHNTGNLRLPHNLDYTLFGSNIIVLFYTGTIWIPMPGTFGWQKPRFFADETGSQTITTAVTTKITWDAENEDVGGYFDLANERYLPLIPGLYFFEACQQYSSGYVDQMDHYLYFYKNGFEVKQNRHSISGTTPNSTPDVFSTYMNGSTDYVEVFTRHAGGGGTANLDGGDTKTYFKGFLVHGYKE